MRETSVFLYRQPLAGGSSLQLGQAFVGASGRCLWHIGHTVRAGNETEGCLRRDNLFSDMQLLLQPEPRCLGWAVVAWWHLTSAAEWLLCSTSRSSSCAGLSAQLCMPHSRHGHAAWWTRRCFKPVLLSCYSAAQVLEGSACLATAVGQIGVQAAIAWQYYEYIKYCSLFYKLFLPRSRTQGMGKRSEFVRAWAPGSRQSLAAGCPSKLVLGPMPACRSIHSVLASLPSPTPIPHPSCSILSVCFYKTRVRAPPSCPILLPVHAALAQPSERSLS